MDKQYVVLADYKDNNISWQKGQLILLDPELALPLLGNVITPLYSAIKAGTYNPEKINEPVIVKIIDEVKEILTPPPTPPQPTIKPPDSNDSIKKPEPTTKKLLQNKLQAQIIAKKAELAQKNK